MRLSILSKFIALTIAVVFFCQPAIAQPVTNARRLNPGIWLVDAPNWMGATTGNTRLRMHVSVGAAGLITHCSIVTSSGSDKLDTAACFLVSINGRYEPARDAGGNPIASEDDLSFVITANAATQIDYPMDAFRRSEQGLVRVTLEMGIDGKVKKCTIFKSSGSPSLDAATCHILTETYRQVPPRDNYGNYVPFTSEDSIDWKIPNH